MGQVKAVTDAVLNLAAEREITDTSALGTYTNSRNRVRQAWTFIHAVALLNIRIERRGHSQ